MARNRTAKDQTQADAPEQENEEDTGSENSEAPVDDEGDEDSEPPVLGAGLDTPSTPVAPPLTGAERLALLESKVEQLFAALHGMARNTFANAEAHLGWLDEHFPNRNPPTIPEDSK